MKTNSTIYKNPYEDKYVDLSTICTLNTKVKEISINQENHYFKVGDVLYYDIYRQVYDKALAVNSIESEVCGCVLKVVDNNNFIMITEGFIPTNRYSFDTGTILYLSEINSGRLNSIEPSYIVKQVATQTDNGIIINIQRGFSIHEAPPKDGTLEPYTKDELDEIIKNIW